MAKKKDLNLDQPKDVKTVENEKMLDFSSTIATSHAYIKEFDLEIEKLQILRDNFKNYLGPEKEKKFSEELSLRNSNCVKIQEKMQVMLDLLQKSFEERKNEDKVRNYLYIRKERIQKHVLLKT
jgi:hypothetical protein